MKENVIIMETVFTITANHPMPFKKEGAYFHSLVATVEGKEIPFDFAAYNYKVEELGGNQYRFHYLSGVGKAFNDYGLSEYFVKTYEEMGIKMEELTAEKFANMTKLNDFMIEPNGEISRINIIKMAFSDAEEYYVSRSVLDQWEVAVNYGKSTAGTDSKKKTIDIGFANLCVEIDEQGIRPEVYVFLEGKEDIEEYQEICMVSQAVTSDSQDVIPDHVQCMVWADSDNENYTDKFIIPGFHKAQ